MSKQDLIKEIERTEKRILSARAHNDWKLLDTLYSLRSSQQHNLSNLG
jgi:hypothetical protein